MSIKNMTVEQLERKCCEFLAEMTIRANNFKTDAIINKKEIDRLKYKEAGFHWPEFGFGLFVGIVIGFIFAGKLLLK